MKMKKYIFSFLMIIAFTMSIHAFNYKGVWIEHFAININVGNSRTFSIKPRNNTTVSAASWDGSRTYYGAVDIIDDNRIVIYSNNGNITLDRFEVTGDWLYFEQPYSIVHVQRNVVNLIDLNTQQSKGQRTFIVNNPSSITIDGFWSSFTRQSFVDKVNKVGEFFENFGNIYQELGNDYE